MGDLPDNVGVVVETTDAHFDHGGVHFLFDEHVKGHDGQKLEIVGHVVLGLLVARQPPEDVPEVTGERFSAQRFAVDADPFAHLHQVW